MSNTVEVTITASDSTQTGIKRAEAAFSKFAKSVKSNMDSASDATEDFAHSAGSVSRAERGFDKVGTAAVGMNAALDTATGALEGIDAVQNGAAREADRLARAQNDVEQAMSDGRQAALDLKQAQQDLTQAQNDGKQAAIDSEQARIDLTQADLDAATAQKEYNKAVKEHGADSEEARQAAIDLKQAKTDQAQAVLDLAQSEADAKQATIDSTQATEDAKQANIDAKTAQVDLNEAQRESDPGPIQKAMAAVQTYGSVLAGAALAMQALSVSTLKSTATSIASKTAMVAAKAATMATAGAQWLLNAALSANPIGLVVVGIAALVAGLVLAYKNSKTFRVIVQQAFDAVRLGGAKMIEILLKAFKALVGGWMSAAEMILKGASAAFGWIPGVGDKLKSAQRAFGSLKTDVNNAFDKMIGKSQEWQRSATESFKTRKLRADIQDWSAKLSKAKKQLSSVPDAKKAKLRGDIADLQRKINKAKADLNSVKDKTVTLNVVRHDAGYADYRAGERKASGGPVGRAASGGSRGNMTLVGEEGPELVNLPGGSFVHTAGATSRMLSQGNSGGTIQIEWVGSNAGDEFLRWLKKNIRIRGGSGPSSVQVALGG